MYMALAAYVKMVTEENSLSGYKIHVYADHLSFLDKWSFLLSRSGIRIAKATRGRENE